MFFCTKCEQKYGWPNSIFKSYGQCEMCDGLGPCNDVPSKYLPTPKKVVPKLDIDQIT